jgi:hypothetical protein
MGDIRNERCENMFASVRRGGLISSVEGVASLVEVAVVQAYAERSSLEFVALHLSQVRVLRAGQVRDRCLVSPFDGLAP